MKLMSIILALTMAAAPTLAQQGQSDPKPVTRSERFSTTEKKPGEAGPVSRSERFSTITAPSRGRFSLAPDSSRRFAVTVERNQRFGIQQVGEAEALAAREQQPVRPAVSEPVSLTINADRLVEQGKIEQAINLYTKAIKQQPRLADAHNGLGFALLKSGDFDRAVAAYNEALAIEPDNAEAQLNLGVALYRSGRIDDALTQYQHALAVKKEKYPAAHFNLGMAYAHKGQFDKSIGHYRAAIEQRGSYPEAANNLGLVYEAMGNFEDAAKQFRLAIEQQRGRYPLAHYNLARFYHGQAQEDLAITEFETAIKQQANFPEAYLDLGNLYMIRSSLSGTAELDKAVAAYRKAIEFREGFYPLAHENLAIALSKKGNQREAINEYRTAFNQYDGQCPETLHNLVMTILKKNLFLIGNELSRPDNAGNIKSAKDSSNIDERLAESLERYEELEDEQKSLADVRYCAGLAYAALGDWMSAIDEFDQAIKLSGQKDGEARTALVTVYELNLIH